MDNFSEADDLMIRAVSILGHAKSLKDRIRFKAILELKFGASVMNKSIKLNPESIQNRITRLRHLLGATINSPVKFYQEVDSDFEFLINAYEKLSLDEKANLLSAKGEYEIFKGNKEKGLGLIKESISITPDTSIGMYAKTLYDRLSEN